MDSLREGSGRYQRDVTQGQELYEVPRTVQ